MSDRGGRAVRPPRSPFAPAAKPSDDNNFASADLYGVLANVCADLDASAMQSTSEFKKIVGGDPIHAERKHRDAFVFTPYARLLFSTNEPPPTPDVSRAFFDRWIVLPFLQRFRGTAAEDKAPHPEAEHAGGTLRTTEPRARRARTSTPQRRLHHQRLDRAGGGRVPIAVDTVAGYLSECVDFDPKGAQSWPTCSAAIASGAR